MSSLDNTKERKLGGSGRDTCKSSLYSYNMMLLVMIYVLTLLLVRGSLHWPCYWSDASCSDLVIGPRLTVLTLLLVRD